MSGMFGRTNREFQKGLDPQERRRNREDSRLRLRKQDRELRNAAKRRAFNNRRKQQQQQSQYGQQSNQQQQNQVNPNDVKIAEMLHKLPHFVQGCYKQNNSIQEECCSRIRKLLSIEKDPPIDQVIASGVVPRLVQFLQFNNPKLQFEAAWALTNIASGTAEHTAEVIKQGSIRHFVTLMGSQSKDVAEQAVWALGNIAGDSPECRDQVLDLHGLDYLGELLKRCMNVVNNTAHSNGWRFEQVQQSAEGQQMIQLLRNVTWTLSNFCRGKPQPKSIYLQKAIQLLTIMLTLPDVEILQDACWAFSYISDDDSKSSSESSTNTSSESFEEDEEQQNNNNNNNNDQEQLFDKIGAMKSSGALKSIIDCLGHEAFKVKHPALRTVGNIVTGNDQQTQDVINMGALDMLLPLLKHTNKQHNKQSIVKEACWTISNITAGTETQIDSVVNANIFPTLIDLLRNAPFEVKKEAAWAISNATSGGNKIQIKYLVHHGVIQPLCQLLNPKNNTKVILVAMEGLQNILEKGENEKQDNGNENPYATFIEEARGLDTLEELQSNESVSDHIYEMAQNIVKTYWGDDNDMPDFSDNQDTVQFAQQAQGVNENQFGFGFQPQPQSQQQQQQSPQRPPPQQQQEQQNENQPTSAFGQTTNAWNF